MSDRLTLFVFEPHAGALKRYVAALSEARVQVVPASTVEEATTILEEDASLSALLISHCASGIELSQYAREFSSVKAPVIAMVGRDVADPDAVQVQMEADGFLLCPFSASAARSVLSLCTTISELRARSELLARELRQQPAQVRRLASAINSRTGFYQFDFIKDLLVVEVRRAKRYDYPLALLLVGLDPIVAIQEIKRPQLEREIMGGLAVAIAKSVRDIDIPIHYADDRVLVFLPHTDLAGAEEVGRRIKRRIKRVTYRGDGVTAQVTASVGVAGLQRGESLTFSRLIKDASVALKAAQLKGGDQVIKRINDSTVDAPQA